MYMGTDNLKAFLQNRLNDSFRGMIKYDSTGKRVEYLRNDIGRQRLERHCDRMIQRMKPEASPAEKEAFPVGELHATLRYFDEAIILHLPTSQQGGVIVSLEPDVGRQFNCFVNSCLQKLHSFRRSDSGETDGLTAE